MDKPPLTQFSKETTDKAKMFDALMVTAFFLVVCWFMYVLDDFLGYHFRSFGLEPRSFEGLRGVVTMHFLHSDLKHIAQNSLGFLVLNSFLFYFYRSIAFQVFLGIFFFSPLLLWVFGRDGNHIGASVIIYGLFAFLFISGMIRRNPLLMRVALVVILYYGSLVWYIFPVDARISWEGHASGFLIGAVMAFGLRKKGPRRKVYQFELEPELPDDENAYWKTQIGGKPAPGNPPETTVTVKYHYKDKERDGEEKMPTT